VRRDAGHDERRADRYDERYEGRYDGHRRGHGGPDLHALARDLLPRLLANKPLLAAVAGVALLLVVLAVWLLVTLIGAVGQGGLKAIVDPAVEAGKTIWEGAGKPALPR
jgi:hypothetical protein